MKFTQFTWKASPNFNKGGIIKHLYLVFHGTGGGLDSSLAWLCNPESNVSAHFLVGKVDKVYQLVDTDDKAWHAGKKSAYHLTKGFNSYSIGVEFENLDNKTDPYTDFQYNMAALIHRLIWEAYPTMLKTVGHEDILKTKHDPGPMFDWWRFKQQVFTPLNPAPAAYAPSKEEFDAVTWASDNGLILGPPDAMVNRGALAVILKRFHDKFFIC